MTKKEGPAQQREARKNQPSVHRIVKAPADQVQREVDVPLIAAWLAEQLSTIEAREGFDTVVENSRALMAGLLRFCFDSGRPLLAAELFRDLNGGFQIAIDIIGASAMPEPDRPH